MGFRKAADRYKLSHPTDRQAMPTHSGRADILAGLITDVLFLIGQLATAERVLAEIISSDVALLVTFNQAIDGVINNNQKARQNPKALAQLDGYKRPLVGSLSANLQRFGMERVAKVESLQEIIEEMRKARETKITDNKRRRLKSAPVSASRANKLESGSKTFAVFSTRIH